MPKKSSPPTTPISTPAILSFLKETKGLLNWSTQDLAGTLNLSRAQAAEVLTLLRAQGYVQAQGGTEKSAKWLTTTSGETVSGSKLPRFNPEKVRQALASLQQAIAQNNKSKNSPFKITRAVAFGDFLQRAANTTGKVQAADVGIELTPRSTAASKSPNSPAPLAPKSAEDAASEHAFLLQLRNKSSMLNLQPWAPWMLSRSHLNLLTY